MAGKFFVPWNPCMRWVAYASGADDRSTRTPTVTNWKWYYCNWHSSSHHPDGHDTGTFNAATAANQQHFMHFSSLFRAPIFLLFTSKRVMHHSGGKQQAGMPVLAPWPVFWQVLWMHTRREPQTAFFFSRGLRFWICMYSSYVEHSPTDMLLRWYVDGFVSERMCWVHMCPQNLQHSWERSWIRPARKHRTTHIDYWSHFSALVVRNHDLGPQRWPINMCAVEHMHSTGMPQNSVVDTWRYKEPARLACTKAQQPHRNASCCAPWFHLAVRVPDQALPVFPYPATDSTPI